MSANDAAGKKGKSHGKNTAAKGKSSGEATEAKPTPGEWFREQVEAIVVAIILALLIRHFAVEAFKIPTGSMLPTLFGAERSGDRILVFKPSYLIGKPERWDIIVFKYPLNSSVNYIKRCVGLPGESLAIRHGDIYVDGKVVKKPRRIQKNLWKHWPVYPRPGADDPVEQFFLQEPEGSFERSGRDVVAESTTPVALRYPTPIRLGNTAMAYPDPGILQATRTTSVVGDVSLRFRAKPESADTLVFAEIRESDQIFRAELPVGEAPRITHRELRDSGDLSPDDADAAIEIGRADDIVIDEGSRQSVAFSYVDGTIQLEIGGELVLDIEHPIEAERRARNHVRFGLDRGRAAFRDVNIYRDIYHTTQGISTTVQIPEGHYFALGDNTLESKDSRMWERAIVDVDGNEVSYDDDERAWQQIGRTIVFADRFGQKYTIDAAPKQQIARSEPAPFVPEEYIIGKAFSTFWPILRDGELNLKFVH